MIAGVHYVEMTLLDKVHGLHAKMGVVRHFNGQGFNAATGGYAHQQGWLLDTADGNLCYYSTRGRWAGMPQSNEIKQGDVVGLLLDLEQRTLSAFLNGARLGVMAAPGMKNIYDPVDGPSAPLCWAVELDGRFHLGAHRAQAAARAGADCGGGGGGRCVVPSQLPSGACPSELIKYR